MKPQADLAVIGLAVMGENLALNLESKGFTVACYNRTTAKVDAFLAGRAQHKNILGRHDPAELVSLLARPRVLLLMVRAGFAVDELIDELSPLLEPGDILVDGGNSHYLDTIRRAAAAQARGLLYVGAGISGGEEGALLGPSLMPGGDPAAWPRLQPLLQAIAARADDGSPCCDWIGPDGSGHFVKMVHNGIEYGDMQILAETYHLMSRALSMSPPEMAPVFLRWNQGPLDSYLVDITARILAKTDKAGHPLVDLILDAAGQKGTGKWTSQAGLDLGVGIPQIAEAVFARCLSAIKDERVAASRLLPGPSARFPGDRDAFLADLELAAFAAKLCSYAQGFQLLRAASDERRWALRYGDIARLWRAGCIIRARFLSQITQAFQADPALPNLLLAPTFQDLLRRAQPAWRRVVKSAIDLGLPLPSISSALAYYDAYRCARLPANLLQAQRDFFGAHTYERVDKPRGQFFHTDWTGQGGPTASTSYFV